MRFASLESVGVAASGTVRRFPVPLLCAWAAGGVIGTLILVAGDHPQAFAAARALTLGIPMAFALALLAQRAGDGTRGPLHPARLLPVLLLLLALILLAEAFPRWSNGTQWRRFAQLTVFAHALVAFLPYAAVREPNGFWQYNRALLERFILATIFSGVLVAGLEGALLSLKPLFAITVSGKAFALVPTAIGFVFHPWYFLAGVPRDLAALESRRDYPGVLRVFAQFILLPLVAIYQVLLTAYLVRVLVTGQWPSGLIGRLVSAEATAGVLVLLLLHPVREQAENLWVRTFSRAFYLALLPSLAMLALSIAKRLGQYGVTEDRYFVVALTAWLAAISLYFIARPDGDIRWIPVTLAALALLTFAGPWGAYDVSFASQRSRLVRLLEANGMLEHGVARRGTYPVPFAARRELSSVLTWLLDARRPNSLRPIMGDVLAAADSGSASPRDADGTQRAQRVARRLGFEYVDRWQRAQADDGMYSFTRTHDLVSSATRLGDLDYHVHLEGQQMRFDAGGRHLGLGADAAGRRFVLWEQRDGGSTILPRAERDTLGVLPLSDFIAAVRAGSAHGPGGGAPSLELTGDGARGHMLVWTLMGRERERLEIDRIECDLYFSLPHPSRFASPDGAR